MHVQGIRRAITDPWLLTVDLHPALDDRLITPKFGGGGGDGGG